MVAKAEAGEADTITFWDAESEAEALAEADALIKTSAIARGNKRTRTPKAVA